MDMKRACLILFCLSVGFGCDDGGDDADDGTNGGSAGTAGGSAGTAGGGTGGSSAGKGGSSGSSAGGSAGQGGSSAGCGGASGSSAGGNGDEGGTGGDVMGESGAGGEGSEPLVGVCGKRSEGIVTTDSYEAYEELFLLGDEGFGEDMCVVRFDVRRVGDAPPGCDESAGQQDMCLWTHLVEYSNPTVMLDVDGACASSGIAPDAATIAAIEGVQVAYGYVREYQGHNSVLMTYSEERSVWEPGVNAGWSPETGDFQYDRRDDVCNY
jgi:hypothetical protein